MSLDPISSVLSQIEYLIASLNKKTAKTVTAELNTLVSIWGRETEIHLLYSLLSTVDINGDSRAPIKETPQTQFLRDFVVANIAKPGFTSNFCQAFDSQSKQSKVSGANLANVCKALRLSRVLEVVFCLILLHSNKVDTRSSASELLRKKFPKILSSHLNPDTCRETGIYDSSVELIHDLLFSLVTSAQFDVSSDLLTSFVESLRKDFPQIRVPVVISPYLYSDSSSTDIIDVAMDRATASSSMDIPSVKTITGSLALQLQEVGYAFTANVESCRKHFEFLLVHDITPSNIAHVLAMMVRTHTGLKNGVLLVDSQSPWLDDKSDEEPTTWKVEVFVQVLNQLVPGLSWTRVVAELDHPGFAVKDRQGLMLLTRALLMGLQNVPFPAGLLYTPWTNGEGQLTWIQQILRNPDIFYFTDYAHRSVQCGDVVKLSAEESKEVLTWLSLDLVEILLTLGEVPGLLSYVNECFRYPVQNCPELLTMALIQANVPMSPMRENLLLGLMHLLLNGQAKDSRMSVFAYAANAPVQHTQRVKEILLHSIADWYNRNQDVYDRLTKIFQIATKLKILLDLLNLPQHLFTIELACLAAKCDYVNLSRWLSEKLNHNGEPFVQGCVLVLKRRCPGLAVGQEANRMASSSPLSTETVQTILTCLQSVVNNLSSSTLANEIVQMCNQFRAMLRDQQQQQVAANQAQQMNTSIGAIGAPSVGTGSTTPTAAASLMAIGGRVVGGANVGGLQQPAPFASRPSFNQSFGAVDNSSAFNIGGSTIQTKMDTIGSHLHNQQQQQASSFSQGEFGGHNLFNVQQPFAQQLSASAPSPTSALVQQAPYGATEQSNPTLRTAVTGWASGFGSSTMSMTNPMMPTSRQTVAPQPPPVSAPLPSNNGAETPLDVSQTFPDDVQEEANTYFQQIYTQPPQPSMSIEQFLDVLKRFRDSSDKKQRDVFACMIKNLFEEYSFFEQYPDKELQTTALLFGGVVRENLVSGMPLMFALRVVMESLRQDPSKKLYKFGTVALDQFKMRLKDYPGYCQRMLQQSPPVQVPPKLMEFIQYGAREELPPGACSLVETPSSETVARFPAAQTQQLAPPSLASIPPVVTTAAAPSTATSTTPLSQLVPPGGAAVGTPARPAPTLNSTNIDTLVTATAKEDSTVAVPAESVVEKVAFLFNNLSQSNMTQKVAEMKGLIDEDHLPWLSQYLVMKRVSAESNFHNLYSNFVTALNNKNLNALILKETFRNIKILLRSDKAAANFSDRTLLKNLGHWLGMISLAVNKPILHLDLDAKSLLLEAFWLGQQELLYVVPFVAKILESCQKSKVFKPPNPWTMAILNILGELHQQPDLKLNLKFEIEVLCRFLSVELNSLKVTNILKDPNLMDRFTKEGRQLSNPARLEKPTMANTLQPSPVPPGTGAGQSAPAVQGPSEEANAAQPSAVTPTPTAARFSYHDIYVNSFQGLTPHISVNAALPLFQFNPPLKNLVRPAIEHAVGELMNPVADRAIKVAMTTTENDFALESDEGRMRLAAQNMARSLTAGMAMITCRDPLQYGIQGYLKQAFYSSLRGATSEQQRMIEEAVQAITEDNVELAQCFIVKFAAERALGEIDKRLSNEYEIRRQSRLEGRQYVDQQAAKFQAERMPESIRLKLGHVGAQQLFVYEDFGKNVPGFKPSTSEDLFAPLSSNNPPPMWPPASGGGRGVGAASGGGVHGGEDDPVFQQLLRDVEARLPHLPHQLQSSPAYQGLVSLRDALSMAAQNPRESVIAQALVQKLVEILLEHFVPRFYTTASAMVNEQEWKEWMQMLSEAFVASVKHLAAIFGSPWVQKQVTKTLIDCRHEFRFNVDAVDVLIRSQLVNMVTYDLQLANSMENGMNFKAVDFAQHLVRRCLLEERGSSVTDSDLSNTIEMLTRISNTRMTTEGPPSFDAMRAPQQPPQVATESVFPAGAFGGGSRGGGLNEFSVTAIFNPASLLGSQQQTNQQPFGQNVLSSSTSSVLSVMSGGSGLPPPRPQTVGPPQTRPPAAYFAQLESGVSNVREYAGDDPPGLQDKAEYLLREWVNMHHTPAAAKDPTKAFSVIVSQMHQHGILKSDDLITRFFRLCTEMCVDLCYRALSDPTSNPNVIRARCFHTLDAFVRLIALLVKHSGDGQHTTKLSLLNKVLGIIAGVLLQDHEVRRGDFHQLPFHRIFITLFLELTAVDPLLEPIQLQILEAFCNTLHAVRPQRNPSFTFTWLDILGHRAFIGRVLVTSSNQKAWSMYARLLIDHLQFLAPFLRNIEFQKPITLVYKGTLRILLVLLHDLPELLCDFHYALCDVIPPNCVQLRNLILSAYPRNMRLPDPFMPNLKVDQLPEINSSPRILANFQQAVQPASLKTDLDLYLKNRAPVSFLSELRSKLQICNEPGEKYNIPLMNAVVLYVGVQAIQAIQAKEQRPSISTIAHTAHMDIFQNLAVDLDTEGRYLFFNAIANQLRYPNSHTHYFSCTLLYLFAEANSEAIQEQITRILFERLVALRPHPWGLLITFIELIKNPFYKFWNHQFVRCAPEIEK